ncbi:MAG: hypothetical protein M4579_003573 [Chaenotheca gracillima]|nr:MAG: hypothetical protein M4579_003573 [Chaenotheca gracillima]
MESRNLRSFLRRSLTAGAVNADSTVEPRQQLKLTKPRPIGSTPTSPYAPSQITDISFLALAYDTDRVEDAITSTAGHSRSRPEARQQLRQHLFGEDDEQTNLNTKRSQDSSLLLEGDFTPSSGNDNLSRASSVSVYSTTTDILTTPLSARRGSRLSLVAESVRPEATPSSDTEKETDTQPTTESIQPTMRRRSLLTPGIATRGRPSNVLRKPPPPQQLQTPADREYYFNPALPESSPLSWLAAMDLAGGPQISRSSTPCDLEYSHLSGLRRGTLHITNGAASPIPSLRAPSNPSRCSNENRSDEEYFSASEGESRPAVPPKDLKNAREELRPAIPLKEPTRTPPRTPLGPKHTRLGSIDSQVMAPRAESPLKEVMQADQFDSLKEHRKMMTINTTFPADFELGAQQSPDRASTFAQEYMEELPSSPYASVSNENMRLAVQSKPDAMDDDLFGDDASSRSSISDQFRIPTSREDALRILSGETGEGRSRASSQSPAPPKSSDSKLSEFSIRRKPLEKADSGYSSNGSVYSFTHMEKFDLVTEGFDLSFQSTPKSSLSELAPSCPQRAAPPVPRKSSRRFTVSGIPASSSGSMPLLLDTTQKTLPATPTIPKPAHTGPRKLQKKFRPKSLQRSKEITVQSHRDFSDRLVPPVPCDISAKLAEHLKQFPTLDHTFPSLSATNSKSTDDGSSIADEGNLLATVTFPCQDDTSSGDEDESERAPRRRSQSTTRSARRKTSSRSRTRSEYRASVAQEHDIMTAIADFGTVAGSLGSSPYHAGAMALKNIRPGPHPTQSYPPQPVTPSEHRNNRHSSSCVIGTHTSPSPHHLERPTAPRRISGMAEETAIHLARERSRDYNPHYNALPLLSPASEDIPPMPRLLVAHPHSYSYSHPPTDTTPDAWEAHMHTWRRRRQSASEGLLGRPAITSSSLVPTPASPSIPSVSGVRNASFKVDIDANAHAPQSKKTLRRSSRRTISNVSAGDGVAMKITPTTELGLEDVARFLRE